MIFFFFFEIFLCKIIRVEAAAAAAVAYYEESDWENFGLVLKAKINGQGVILIYAAGLDSSFHRRFLSSLLQPASSRSQIATPLSPSDKSFALTRCFVFFFHSLVLYQGLLFSAPLESESRGGGEWIAVGSGILALWWSLRDVEQLLGHHSCDTG